MNDSKMNKNTIQIILYRLVRGNVENSHENYNCFVQEIFINIVCGLKGQNKNMYEMYA